MIVKVPTKCLIKCKNFESGDANRKALQGTLITKGEIVATDGQVIIKISDDRAETESPVVARFAKYDLFRLMGSGSEMSELDTDKLVAVSVGKKGARRVCFDIINEPFPDYQSIFKHFDTVQPESFTGFEFAIDVKLLQKFNDSVKLTVKSREDTILVTPVNSLIKYVGIIMPVRID